MVDASLRPWRCQGRALGAPRRGGALRRPWDRQGRRQTGCHEI